MAERRIQPPDIVSPGQGPIPGRLAPLRAVGKPAPVTRPGIPAPVRKAVTAIAVGAALQVGTSLAARYLAAPAGKRGAMLAASRALRAANRSRVPLNAGREPNPAGRLDDDLDVVSETLVVRRVWMRRSQG